VKLGLIIGGACLGGAAVAAAVVLTVGGHSGDGGREARAFPNVLARDTPAMRFSGGDLPGTVYLLSGQTPLFADLYRAEGDLSAARRLTHNGRVSLIAANRHAVVAANARHQGADRVDRVALDRPDGLPGQPIARFGQSPALSASGKLLFQQPQYTDDGGDAGTRVYGAGRIGDKLRVLWQTRANSENGPFAVWGPGERLVVSSGRSSRVIVDPGGPHERVIHSGLRRVANVLASARRPAAEGTRARVRARVPRRPPAQVDGPERLGRERLEPRRQRAAARKPPPGDRAALNARLLDPHARRPGRQGLPGSRRMGAMNEERAMEHPTTTTSARRSGCSRRATSRSARSAAWSARASWQPTHGCDERTRRDGASDHHAR